MTIPKFSARAGFSLWLISGMIPGFSATASAPVSEVELFPPGTPEAPPVDSLVAEALRNNPSLMAARHREAAAQAGVRRAGAYEPPTLGVETGKKQAMDATMTPTTMIANGIFARQMIMFPGKVSAMKQAERHRASMTNFETASEADQIARNVREAYYELYMFQRRLEINFDNRRVMEKFVGVARAQYEAGMGRMEDILRAQTESSRLRSESLVLRQNHRAMEAMLLSWLDRPSGAAIGPIPALESTPSAELPADTLASLALRRRPDLLAMGEDVRMNRWELAAARRTLYPDFMVEGKWMSMMGPDEWSVMAGVTLPLAPWSFGGVRGARDQGRARLREAESRERAMRNMVGAEVRGALAEVEAARSRRDLARDATLPQAEQTLLSTEAAYRSGKTEFLMLLDAYRMVFMAKEEFYMAQADLQRGGAELRRAVGGNEVLTLGGALPQGDSR